MTSLVTAAVPADVVAAPMLMVLGTAAVYATLVATPMLAVLGTAAVVARAAAPLVAVGGGCWLRCVCGVCRSLSRLRCL
ncbi:hypothetical protein PI124_g6016 [Phytophthora idaei]|nr:hypothetical protein PI125_g11134 [Phytophthora idaei]KAG3142128.1 hypothetical protein PI126_g15191 [Phytophthora idaei]KAG3249332.1 hypothetical protein PI124_g6016 [Phytophthora idaei]